MKIQLASDLHLEFSEFRFREGFTDMEPAPGADVLVLAGDIGVRTKGIERFKDWPVPVIYVYGNHEMYDGNDLSKTVIELRETCAGLGMHFLEKEALVLPSHPDVRFLGTAMWTDYLLFGRPKQKFCMLECGDTLVDHSRIRSGGKRFTPKDALFRHVASREWLNEQFALPFDGKTVVVTHHGCHWKSVAPRWRNDLVSAGFCSDLTPLLENADAWLHGHCHDSFDYQVGRCRVVVNPRGYPLGGGEYENEDFDSQLVIEV